MKRRSRLLLYMALLCSIPFLLVALLHTPPVRRYALERLRNYLSEGHGIDLTAAGLDYNLLTLSAEFEQLSLRSRAPADLPPFVSARYVRARLGFLDLLRGHPVIQDARLEGIRLDIHRDSLGRANLPPAPGNRKPPSEQDTPLPLSVMRLDARDGSFRFTDTKGGTRFELPLWKLEVRGRTSTQTHVIEFRTQKAGLLVVEGRSLTLAALSLEAELSPQLLEVKSLAVEAASRSTSDPATYWEAGFEAV